jgi:hypothetical protein
MLQLFPPSREARTTQVLALLLQLRAPRHGFAPRSTLDAGQPERI